MKLQFVEFDLDLQNLKNGLELILRFKAACENWFLNLILKVHIKISNIIIIKLMLIIKTFIYIIFTNIINIHFSQPQQINSHLPSCL